MGFSDAFTKESATGALSYDNVASVYFGFTILVIIVSIWSLSVFYRSRKREVTDQYHCECKMCCNKKIKQETKEFIPVRLWIEMIICGILWSFIVYIGKKKLPELNFTPSFDPYSILGVTPESSDREIKKKFRTLSLKYHPDKNPNDAGIAAKYILISKAYKTLTDQIAKSNFLKYGNPEGRYSLMKMSIGLPSFLLEQDMQIIILFIFVLSVVLIIPTGMFLLYDKIKQKSIFGLHQSTVYLVSGSLTSQHTPGQIIELICSSNEIRNMDIKITTDELENLRKIANIDKINLRVLDNKISFAVYMINLHLARKSNQIPDKFKSKLNEILGHSEKITQLMIHLAYINNWANIIQTVINIRKSLIQSIQIGTLPIMQIPHISFSEFEQKMKLFPNVFKKLENNEFDNFSILIDCILSKKDIFLSALTDSQINDIEIVSKLIPNIKISAEIYVDDEIDIVVGDIATLKVIIDRFSKTNNDRIGVHSPYYPKNITEGWFIFVVNAHTNMLFGSDYIKSLKQKSEYVFNIPILQPGNCKLQIVCLSDCYFGIDQQKELNFRALSMDKNKRDIFVHPDDVALDNNKNFADHVTNMVKRKVSDSNESEIYIAA